MEQVPPPMLRPFKEILDEVDRGLDAEREARTGTDTKAGTGTTRSIAGPAEDAINPAHYRKHPSGIECIEVTRHMNFNVGNAIKYIWRHMDKGDPVENLKKAQWYLDDEIRRLEKL